MITEMMLQWLPQAQTHLCSLHQMLHLYLYCLYYTVKNDVINVMATRLYIHLLNSIIKLLSYV